MYFVSAGIATASSTEVIHLIEAPPPDEKVFASAQIIIDEYRNEIQKLGTKSIKLDIDAAHGTIETSWHRVHKGELERKIQIYVWGGIYRIDVWHRSTLGLGKKTKKDYMCRLIEMQLQEKIEKELQRID